MIDNTNGVVIIFCLIVINDIHVANIVINDIHVANIVINNLYSPSRFSP